MDTTTPKSTSCKCELCTHWLPLIRRLDDKLDDEGKALLEELCVKWETDALDLGVAEARLNGSWPGWEMMKGFSPHTHKVVRLTKEEMT